MRNPFSDYRSEGPEPVSYLHVQVLLFCLLGVSLAAVANAHAASRKRSKVSFQDLGYKPPVVDASISLAAKNRPQDLYHWMYSYYSPASRRWFGPKVNERQRFFGLRQAGQLSDQVKSLETDQYQTRIYSNRYSEMPGEQKLFSIFHDDMSLSPGRDRLAYNDYKIAEQLHLFSPKFCVFNNGECHETLEIQNRLARRHRQARWLLEISRLVSTAPANLRYQERQIQALAQYLALFDIQGEIKTKERGGRRIGYIFEVKPNAAINDSRHWIAKLAYRLSNQAAPGTLSFQTWVENTYDSSTDFLEHPLRSELTLPVMAAVNPEITDWAVEHELYRTYHQTHSENHFHKYSQIGQDAWPKHRVRLINRHSLWDPAVKEELPTLVRQLYATKGAFHLEQIGATSRDAVFAQSVYTFEEILGSSWGSSDLEALAKERREDAIQLAEYARSVYRHALDQYNKGHFNYKLTRKPRSAYEMLALPISPFEVLEIFIPRKKFTLSDHLEDQFYSRHVEKELLQGYAWIQDYLERMRSDVFEDWVREKAICYNLFHLADREVQEAAEQESE